MSEENLDFGEDIMKILDERYLQQGENPKQMFERVADAIAEVENNEEYWKDKFYKVMASRRFIPNSPTIMNAGTDMEGNAACYVLNVEDDMDDIFETVKESALIFQGGGGCGLSFSKLRPKGDIVHSTGGESSGPISFMESFNGMAETVKQGGARRGALMGSLSVHHPDIKEFIHIKSERGELENFNISVEITDEFMKAVREGEEIELRNPRGGHPASPDNDMVEEKIEARELFDKMVKETWSTGEPGYLFIDTINSNQPFPVNKPSDEFYIESTNPCGEEPLLPYESCVLGHINLSEHTKGDELFEKEFDWDKIEKTIRIGVRFLDNIIDKEYPLEKIKENTRNNRKIGLGVMGWHEALMQMGVKYNSEEAFEMAEEVSQKIRKIAEDVSEDLGEEKGAFPNIENAKDEIKKSSRRNSQLLTLAPTGTTSMIAGTTYSIEPIHSVKEKKKVLDDEEVSNVNKTVKKLLEEDRNELLITATEIEPKDHIKMQTQWQKNVDGAISKTVNMSEDASIEDVKEAVRFGWREEAKGLTIYRKGARAGEPIKDDEDEEEKEFEKEKQGELTPSERPRKLEGKTIREKLGCGRTMYAPLTYDEEGRLREIFVQVGKSGGCLGSILEALGRIGSLYLGVGGDPEELVDSLKGIRCPEPRIGKQGRSCPDILARIIEEEAMDAPIKLRHEGEVPECPKCSGRVEMIEGCINCQDCGWSKC